MEIIIFLFRLSLIAFLCFLFFKFSIKIFQSNNRVKNISFLLCVLYSLYLITLGGTNLIANVNTNEQNITSTWNFIKDKTGDAEKGYNIMFNSNRYYIIEMYNSCTEKEIQSVLEKYDGPLSRTGKAGDVTYCISALKYVRNWHLLGSYGDPYTMMILTDNNSSYAKIMCKYRYDYVDFFSYIIMCSLPIHKFIRPQIDVSDVLDEVTQVYNSWEQ